MTTRPLRVLCHFTAIVLAIVAVVSPDLSSQGRRGRTSVLVDGHEAVEGEVLVRFRTAAAAMADAVAV